VLATAPQPIELLHGHPSLTHSGLGEREPNGPILPQLHAGGVVDFGNGGEAEPGRRPERRDPLVDGGHVMR
jgi:hypothetical protein